MKYFILCSFLLINVKKLIAQSSDYNFSVNNSKAPIDMYALEHWPSLAADPVISPNGHYISYNISNEPVGTSTLFIRNTSGTWAKSFIGVSNGYFSDDNKYFLFKSADTICFLKTNTDTINKVFGVKSMLSPENKSATWLAYQMINNPDELIVYNIITGDKQQFSDVTNYSFNKAGNKLLLLNSVSNNLRILDLSKGKTYAIWLSKDSKVSNYAFDNNGEQLAFMEQVAQKLDSNYLNNDIGSKYNIWYYKCGMEKAVNLTNDFAEGVDSFVISNSNLEFSRNGLYIFFELEQPVLRKPDSDAALVDVWHYKDEVLKSLQLHPDFAWQYQSIHCPAVISLKDSRIIHLEKGEEFEVGSWPQQINTNYAVIASGRDKPWWKRGQGIYYLLLLKDGSRKILSKDEELSSISFSPGGKYLVYYNRRQNCYFSYELSTGLVRNISNRIPERLDNEYYLTVPNRTFPMPVGIAGWLQNDRSLLIYDRYDIWQVNSLGDADPLNITNGYGKRHHIKLKLVNEREVIEKGISDSSQILLTAFNTLTKYNGFFHTFVGKKADPEKLIMAPFVFYRISTQLPYDDAFDNGMLPLKASKADVWMVKRQSSIEAPNYFLTSDFKKFQALTYIQPQRKYNWLTTELITWKQLDGTFSQGVLYKPENFDPQKKYPIIFHYYETFSYRIYEYPTPYLTTYRMNIPWYVSHGYLVFTPDIHYSIASVSGLVAGDAAVNSIVSAAKYLSRFHYVDTTKMGIQGHSFAGYETNYIITHTNIFAAACEGAGTSDVISGYLGIVRAISGKPLGDKQAGYEIAQGRIGATLWQRPDLYIKYSPIFNAHHVSTPLLIMHNYGDGSIDWNQGVEMYMALRRLEKKVWMLQYDGEGHSLSFNKKNARDYTIRMMQFFDYYLKGELPPIWMTQGIPSRLKGIETGLNLDTSGKRP